MSLGESLNPFKAAEPPVLLPFEAKLLPKFLGVARKVKELPPFSFSEITEGVEDELDNNVFFLRLLSTFAKPLFTYAWNAELVCCKCSFKSTREIFSSHFVKSYSCSRPWTVVSLTPIFAKILDNSSRTLDSISSSPERIFKLARTCRNNEGGWSASLSNSGIFTFIPVKANLAYFSADGPITLHTSWMTARTIRMFLFP
mmetsp:Transcript_8984/g.26121  ORF Transcript_8984/g.26121 Transcript_8984/m.26121 type:complete len:200 (+) Transcript_8984:197-796(+)